jgi:hypothetical protein
MPRHILVLLRKHGEGKPTLRESKIKRKISMRRKGEGNPTLRESKIKRKLSMRGSEVN